MRDDDDDVSGKMAWRRKRRDSVVTRENRRVDAAAVFSDEIGV